MMPLEIENILLYHKLYVIIMDSYVHPQFLGYSLNIYANLGAKVTLERISKI